MLPETWQKKDDLQKEKAYATDSRQSGSQPRRHQLVDCSLPCDCFDRLGSLRHIDRWHLHTFQKLRVIHYICRQNDYRICFSLLSSLTLSTADNISKQNALHEVVLNFTNISEIPPAQTNNVWGNHNVKGLSRFCSAFAQLLYTRLVQFIKDEKILKDSTTNGRGGSINVASQTAF